MIHDEIVQPFHRAKGNSRKIRWLAIVLWTADELNDLCAHENPSHTAIVTRPANTSEIRYAVIPNLV